ncbi:uncharacterized protein LOC127290063 [Leptopilina boulardi]|uniref:uncharacterized protein LOC127290063 n=1 Tax=Leptopilina boulardi TaxID=63433 RepID=UPI0021F6230C|nr:uncharacterized protein LOC127290063 [Leptopilina boulardi]
MKMFKVFIGIGALLLIWNNFVNGDDNISEGKNSTEIINNYRSKNLEKLWNFMKHIQRILESLPSIYETARKNDYNQRIKIIENHRNELTDYYKKNSINFKSNEICITHTPNHEYDSNFMFLKKKLNDYLIIADNIEIVIREKYENLQNNYLKTCTGINSKTRKCDLTINEPKLVKVIDKRIERSFQSLMVYVDDFFKSIKKIEMKINRTNKEAENNLEKLLLLIEIC